MKLQIRIARGERLPFRQEDLRQRGHAIECRVYAEDPDQGFLPSPGRITALRLPGGPGVRDDSGIYEGYEVPIHYDPLLSKLVVWGYSRQDAIRRMRRAVAEYKVLGIKTTLPFFQRVLHHPAFLAGDFDTSFVEKVFAAADRARERPVEVAVAAAAIRAYRERQAARLAPVEAGTAGSAWWRAGLSRSPAGPALDVLFDATVDGRTLRVEVRGKDGRYTVTIDGRPLEVDLFDGGSRLREPAHRGTQPRGRPGEARHRLHRGPRRRRGDGGARGGRARRGPRPEDDWPRARRG